MRLRDQNALLLFLIAPLLLGSPILITFLMRVFNNARPGLYSDTNFVSPTMYNRDTRETVNIYTDSNTPWVREHLNRNCVHGVQTAFSDPGFPSTAISYSSSCEIYDERFPNYLQQCDGVREVWCENPKEKPGAKPTKREQAFMDKRFSSAPASKNVYGSKAK